VAPWRVHPTSSAIDGCPRHGSATPAPRLFAAVALPALVPPPACRWERPGPAADWLWSPLQVAARQRLDRPVALAGAAHGLTQDLAAQVGQAPAEGGHQPHDAAAAFEGSQGGGVKPEGVSPLRGRGSAAPRVTRRWVALAGQQAGGNSLDRRPKRGWDGGARFVALRAC
jgi:hypothetical protein